MSRFLLAFILLTSGAILCAQDRPALHGRVEGRTYYSPTGAFSITIPVLPELGGEITDTANVVTFKDDFNVHVSIAVFPQDATQRWEMSTRGTKDYLAYFVANYVLPDFRQTFEGAQAESARFLPTVMDGSLLAYFLLPGGSMFMDRVAAVGAMDHVPVAKRGNLVFVKNGDIFVISTELAERVIEGKAYKKTVAQEDEILKQRLEDILGKMQFLKNGNNRPTPTGPAAASSSSSSSASSATK